MSEPTKGDWHRQGDIIANEEGKFICELNLGTKYSPKRYVTHAEDKANGRLIAALPKMLKALDLCVEFASAEYEQRLASEDENYINEALTARDVARAALAEAKGE